MAHVKLPTTTGRGRAQMLLVAAFGVAVMLVALALILNTAIYTENIATRGSDISGGKDALRFRAVTHEGIDGSIKYVNLHNNTSDGNYEPLVKPTKYAVWNLSNLSGRQQATDSIVANLSVKPHSPSEGTHVFQRTDLNFSNESSDASWTVARGTHGVRGFSVNVSEPNVDNSTSVGAVSPSDEFFYVNVTDGTEVYNIFIYDDGDNGNGIVLQVDDGSGSTLGTCIQSYDSMGTESRAIVDFSNATVQGNTCPALKEYWSLLDGPFTMHFNNTCGVTGTVDACLTDDPNIEGQFSFIVNQSINDTWVHAGTGTSAVADPNATTAIYSVTVRMTYESKRLYYATDIRSAPGETDE